MDYSPAVDRRNPNTGQVDRPRRIYVREINGQKTLTAPLPLEQRDRWEAKGYVPWDGKPLRKKPGPKPKTPEAPADAG